MNIVPTLDAIASDPEAVAGLPAATLAALSIQAAAVQTRISAQLLANGTSEAASTSTADDEMLTPIEAAELLKQSQRWLSRHARTLPFVKRISQRRFVCSRNGIVKWLGRRS